jgi:hypothetical protein
MKCKHCNKDKDISMFYKDKSKPSGFKPRCKLCDLLSVDVSRRKKYEAEYWSDPERKKKKKASVKKSGRWDYKNNCAKEAL